MVADEKNYKSVLLYALSVIVFVLLTCTPNYAEVQEVNNDIGVDGVVEAIGVIEYVSQETITINDSGFAVAPNLKLYEKNGSSTRLYRFHEGMYVSYTVNPSTNELLLMKKVDKPKEEGLSKGVLTEKEARSAESRNSERKTRKASITFKDGVYKN